MDRSDLRILIVDDEPANVRLLERLLQTAGYKHVTGITDPRQALAVHGALQSDLIVLDLMMPHVDGLTLLGEIREVTGASVYLPVLVVTADATRDTRERALAAGAQDFLTKPFDAFEVLLRIRNLLETRRLHLELEHHARTLEDTVRDRTERMLQSEKLAAMGSLLAGVAHELNNPLAALSAHAHLLQETAPDPNVARRGEKIAEAAERCVRIVRNFLSLARRQAPERGHVLVRQLVQGAVELFAYELRTDEVDVVVDVPTGVPILWADAHQLHQVLVNVIANAQHAMRRTGRPRRLTVSARRDVGRDVVQIRVSDTGAGIAPEALRKIFEPFFTTKPAGEGTGLGLSLCRNIVDGHGGTITAESEPGVGSTIIVELPVRQPDQAITREAALPLAQISGPRRVLVVDDEADVASAVAEALTRDGLDTGVANNGRDALAMLAEREYDLVISDTKMPILDGERLLEALRKEYPALERRFIFLTGDILDREKREFLEKSGVAVLAKPCDLADLRRLVRTMLATPRA